MAPTIRGGRLLAVTGAAAIVVILMAGPAAAAFALVFDSKHLTSEDATGRAQPGEALEVRTVGQGAMGSMDQVLIFFAPASSSHPDAVASRSELEALQGIRFAGRLAADGKGTGHMTLRAPEATGRYQLLAYCPECAPTSEGDNVLWIGGLHVSAAGALPSTGAGLNWVLPVLLILCGSFVLLHSHRRNQPSLQADSALSSDSIRKQ